MQVRHGGIKITSKMKYGNIFEMSTGADYYELLLILPVTVIQCHNFLF